MYSIWQKPMLQQCRERTRPSQANAHVCRHFQRSAKASCKTECKADKRKVLIELMQFLEDQGHPTAEQRHAKTGKICTTPGVKIMADKPPHLPPERHDVFKTCWFMKHADAAPHPNREEQELSHGDRKYQHNLKEQEEFIMVTRH